MKDNFRIIYNGIDFTRFQNKNNLNLLFLKQKLNIPLNCPVIGMVASFSLNKDHKTLLEAASKILERYPTTIFLLIGDGPMLNDIRTLAEKENLGDHFIFTGYRSDVDRLYLIMDLFILLTNSDVRLEGISNALIEAMASGVPVIASAGGGTDEVIENGATGLLVPPKDTMATARSITYLLSDPDKAKKMAVMAKRYVEEVFSLDRYVREYTSLYEEIITKKHGPNIN